jgi:hypothetical protein
MATLNAFLDARSNACYTQGNVRQDHNIDSDDRWAFRGSSGFRRAVVHSGQRAKSKSLSTKLLRQQNLLRDIVQEHSPVLPTARES